jgi:hypothetical protein
MGIENGNPPDPAPGVLTGEAIMPPGVLGVPSLPIDPHPGVRGVAGEAGPEPNDHPARVGRFLIGCGIGGEVMRLVRCRTGFAGRAGVAGLSTVEAGVVRAGERGVPNSPFVVGVAFALLSSTRGDGTIGL